MKTLLCLLLLTCAPALAADYQVGDRLPADESAKPAKFKEVSWDDLLPPDWNPMEPLKGLNLDKMKDSDPRAQEALDKLKAMWRVAPANPAINGRAIRIPGFMVPLEYAGKEVKEFLLVPYFGACIHVPPPPANQIIHVLPARPVKVKTGMDAVWVEGVIQVGVARTEMGDAGYRLKAVRVEAYKER